MTISAPTHDIKFLEKKIRDIFAKQKAEDDPFHQKLDKAWSRYYQKSKLLQKRYGDIGNLPPPKGFLQTILRTVTSLYTIQNYADYLQAKHNLERELQHRLDKITLQHRIQFGNERFLESEEIDNLRGLANFQLKQMALKSHGVIIGAIHAPIETLEIDPKLAAQEWLAKMNALANKSVQTITETLENSHIHSVGKKTAVAEDYPQLPPSLQQSLNDLQGGKQKVDSAFLDTVLKVLSESSPSSLLVTVSNGESNHAFGIFQDESGIWFHDPGRFSVCFPLKDNAQEEMKDRFSQFFTSYQEKLYGQYDRASLSAVRDKADLQYVEEMGLSQNATITQQFAHYAQPKESKVLTQDSHAPIEKQTPKF